MTAPHVLLMVKPFFSNEQALSSPIKKSTHALLHAARTLNAKHITLVQIAPCARTQGTQAYQDWLNHFQHLYAPYGITRIMLLTHESSAALHAAENITPVLTDYIKMHNTASTATLPPFTHIIGLANTWGKNLLPRLAAQLNTGMLSDVIRIIDNKTFVRPIYAGHAQATLSSQTALNILSIRQTAFSSSPIKDKPIQPTSHKTLPILQHCTITQLSPHTHWLTNTTTKLNTIELTTADIVIAGGRGLKSAEAFHQLKRVADLLGAALGASRGAVEAGFAPNDLQIGQTGKVVAPKVYIAVGISGAVQHIAGMKDSQCIIAINSDPKAPIFDVADYGLLGDLFEILPLLEQRLKGL